MPDYRVYTLDSCGHFSDVVPLECADDDAARIEAEKLVERYAVELWQRDRKIAKFDGELGIVASFFKRLGVMLTGLTRF